MAAVAGSKGRIAFPIGHLPNPSFQAALAGRLLNNAVSVDEVVQSITDAARLREIGVDTNMICNLACKYCYLDDRPEAKGAIEAAEWKSYLEPLIHAGSKLIAFIGKEPLADTIALDTISELNEARDHGQRFRIGMVTNGTLIDRRIDHLKSARLDYLDVSLDSMPEINDRSRGEGVFERVVKNIKLYLATSPVHDFSITSVLHKGSVRRYVDFVEFIFSIGIKTAFGSPILRFTERDTAAPLAISATDLSAMIDTLGVYLRRLSAESCNDRQVIIDLPYKYSWLLLKERDIDWTDIKQDMFEAHFLQPDSSVPLFVKFNFFPMSYWRAIRVTHDARVIENMDLAAHRLYDQHTRHCSDHTSRWYFGSRSRYLDKFFADFVRQHADLAGIASAPHDREVAGQLHHLSRDVELGLYV
jgi:molybdenum cofactor biosynthesis enzyme MoaA